MLGHKNPGAGHFATNGSALHHTHQQQQDGGSQANRFVGRQQANHQRGHGHQKDGQREHLLAAQHVTEVGNQNATNGARQITGRKNAQRLQLAHPVWQRGGEKQAANHIGKKDEHHKVIKLECSAQSR